MAAGMQDDFSWKAVGLSALGSAVTAGVGAAAAKGGISALGFLGGNGPLEAADARAEFRYQSSRTG
jgi:hypothetical protein